MRLVCWHDDRLARSNRMQLSGNGYQRLSFQDMNHGIEWRRVLTEAPALVKGEDSHRPRFLFEDLPADNGSLLIIDEGFQIQGLASMVF